MVDLKQAVQQALAFTMRDFATVRDFEAARSVLHDTLKSALERPEQAEPVLTINKLGSLVECSPTIAAFDLPDGEFSLYARPPCRPNCASLEAQNTELDRRLAVLEQPESGGVCARCGGIVYDPVIAQSGQGVPETDCGNMGPVSWGVDWGRDGDTPCCTIIKQHANGTQEVVAVEYGPPRREADQPKMGPVLVRGELPAPCATQDSLGRPEWVFFGSMKIRPDMGADIFFTRSLTLEPGVEFALCMAEPRGVDT